MIDKMSKTPYLQRKGGLDYTGLCILDKEEEKRNSIQSRSPERFYFIEFESKHDIFFTFVYNSLLTNVTPEKISS